MVHPLVGPKVSGSKAKQKKCRQGADTPHLIQQLRAALACYVCSIHIGEQCDVQVPDIKPRNSDEEV